MSKGRFGIHGGQYIPETLMNAVIELEEAYNHYKDDPEFNAELTELLNEYAGRPSRLYFASHMTEDLGGAKVYLKREDLNHTGAHKINNVLGQVLLAKKMGKTRVIAETGAGQHGVATATAAALMGMECEIFMGKEDTERQALNVYRMRLLGAKVNAVTSGTATLKDAVSETMREWTNRISDTHYVLGSVMGPHPFPTIVRDFQAVISKEIKEQILEKEGRLPDAAYFLAIFLGFNGKAAAAISIIGGADGPTSIFLAGKLGQSALMGPIAVAAYSYMSLVPIIQPPIMKLCTTEKERKIKMDQLRPVSKLEKILFPIVITIVVCLILPTTAPLVGMLMLGNLFRECGVVKQLTETASNALMYIVVILLGTSVGASTSAEAFLNADTLKIVVLGLVAFAIGTFGGCMLGKLLCKLTHGKINPLIGSAGVSAVPMAARVSQKVGAEADPTNFLLMHAMGPNVAGVIGTAVAAGTFMAIFGV